MPFNTSTALPNVMEPVSVNPRAVLRKPAVMAATGWSNSTLYAKIKEGVFPAPTKIDPNGRASVWFADDVAAFQQRAIDRQAASA
jgi:prophage regulatory protein